MATAGNQYLQMSSDLTAPLGDIQISARNIAIQSNNNTRSVLNIVRERQSGLTLSASHQLLQPVIDTAKVVREMGQVARRTEDGRYQALALLTSGLTVYNNYSSLTAATQLLKNPQEAINQFRISASLGTSRSDFESLQGTSTPRESTLNAGRDVVLTASGGGDLNLGDSGDISLIGTRLSASRHLSLYAQRDITLAAAVGKDTETTKRSSSAASIGVSFSTGSTGSGVTVDLAASRSNAWSNGWGTTYFNSEAAADGTLRLQAGRHATLSGAKASGETVVVNTGVNFGSGNLTLTSPIDETHYRAKESSWGINANIPIGGTGGSFSLNSTQLKLLADSEAVRQQTAIVAGVGGYDINVAGHTHLQGSAIASKADSWRNRLVTQTLSHEDLVNREVVQGGGRSVGISVSVSRVDGKPQMNLGGSAIGLSRIETQQSNVTKSSIAPGTLTVTRPDLQNAAVGQLKAALKQPLETERNGLQQQLAQLLANEPSQCDWRRTICHHHARTDGGGDTPAAQPGAAPAAGGAITAVPRTPQRTGDSAPAAQVVTAAGTGAGTASEGGDGYSTNPDWTAWWQRVQQLQTQITTVQGRINAIDTRAMQGAGTISRTPDGLHIPLLHTFDPTKATQELRDGVAVTAAFGKAAFKAIGDEAQKRTAPEVLACTAGKMESSECKAAQAKADGWRDGERYKVLLHGIVGAALGGSAGAAATMTAERAEPMIKAALLQAGVTENSAAYNALMTAAKTAIGRGAGATVGAAAAFNADMNNRILHQWRLKAMEQACKGVEAANTGDCKALSKMKGVRTGPLEAVDGLTGYSIQKNHDEQGFVVGAYLVSVATGEREFIMDYQDYSVLTSLPPHLREERLMSAYGGAPHGRMTCNSTSNTCDAQGSLFRTDFNALSRSGKEWTVFVTGSSVDLSQFIFNETLPTGVGEEKVLTINWRAMKERLGEWTALVRKTDLQPTIFGAITVRRIDESSVQIMPDLFNFDIQLKPFLTARNGGTFFAGLPIEAGQLQIGETRFFDGRPVKIIFVGSTPLKRPN